jgi:putative sigma-54 modulation protein
VEQKVGKAQKYFNHIVWAQVTLSVEKRTQQAEVIIHASRHTFRALSHAADLYSAIDLASDKIDNQLKKHTERARDHHKTGLPESMASMEGAVSPVRISVIKQVPLQPMTTDEAALEMDRMGFSFWMFQEKDSGRVNVIFRRQDDSYGLLLPVSPK